MGVIKKTSYTIPIPENATIKNGIVSWKVGGKMKTGKLSGTDKVLCQSEIWIAQFVDENGKLKRVSTKTKDKSAANRVLAKLENEISMIRAGLTARSELNRVATYSMPIQQFVDQYQVKMTASGNTKEHTRRSIQKINVMIDECKIKNLSDINRNVIEKWIATAIERNKKAPRTINSYHVAIKSFLNWCVDSRHLSENPLAKIKKLNEAVGRKKQRRSLTEEELKKLFVATHSRKYRQENKADEHELIYRLLVGTGLRSNELGISTPNQFDFEKCRFFVKAKNTKNRRDDILPIRSDLCERLKKWICKFEIQSNERIFKYTISSLRQSFIRDCLAAGIELKSPDGRSIDVHALRRTFGTMLARAGVPLTTTQRLMRHSTPELTAKLYIDVEPVDMQQAIDKLPVF